MRETVHVTVRWSDLDAYRHVNNVALLRLLEEARIAVFWHGPNNGDGSSPSGENGELTAAHDSGLYVVRQEIEYLRPLGYPREPLPIEMWVSHIGVSSIDVCYEVPTTNGEVSARACTTLAMVDSETGRPRRLREDERARLEPMQDEPITFRRR